MTIENPPQKLKSMGMMTVPAGESIAKNPKTVDLTSINVYPSKYKIVNGEVLIKSINIENVYQQKEELRKLDTTILIGDLIKLDFKFGHYAGGQWTDHFVCGVYRVKEITPNMKTEEVMIRISKLM